MHSQPSSPEALLEGEVSTAWSHVAALTSAMTTNLDKWLGENYRLSLTEHHALTVLSREPGKELRVNDLAKRIGLNPSSTTRLVSRLEAKSLARRDLCEDDGRGVYAVIDKAGETLVQEIHGPYETHLQEVLSEPTAHLPHLDAWTTGAALAALGAALTP